jgi:hypothetical protein
MRTPADTESGLCTSCALRTTPVSSQIMDIYGHWSAPGECSKWRGAGNGPRKWHKRELRGWMIRR